jgi:hypothetical protein
MATPDDRPIILTPYQKLLLIINNKKNDDMDVLEAIRVALPYCKETIAERNAREAAEAASQPRFDGPFESAQDLVAAQAKVMALMAAGQLLAQTGKTFIESLALMAKTMEMAQGPAGHVLQVVGGLPELVVEDPAETSGAVVSLQEA